MSDNSNSTSVSISDEELALFGAPWAKEGMLCKRHAWETVGKKAKNNKWMDVFVVIQKGQLSMFVFGGSSSGSGTSGGVVGGGNWAKNANQVGGFMLSHSLAHILPPPGIDKRPNSFVLSLADGAVYFFQAGTEELANEWVSTCNYWAARQSKEPLPGGVSNIEYGWNRVEDDAHAQDDEGITEAEKALAKERENRAKGEYSADTFSLRSQRSRLGARLGDGFSTLRGGANPYTERIYINEWKAPMPNMHVSTLDEEGQLESLRRQTESLKEELKKHDALKVSMTALVSDFLVRHDDF